MQNFSLSSLFSAAAERSSSIPLQCNIIRIDGVKSEKYRIRPFISSLSEANDLFECEIFCRYYYYKNPFKCYRILRV